MKFDPKSFEGKWRERWAAGEGAPRADDARAAAGEKRYCLVEFPYPSGNLHVGHWYAFSVPDIYVRQRRMAGENVMFPIGFDAFGLPAENAAIKHGVNPRDWTRQNMADMEGQLKTMGASFDWDRKVATCEPEYYRWTQWLFLKLMDAGLAYQAEAPVNWCPQDKTVLANEQVKDGRCDRCGAEVEQRRMKQWMLRITKFADALVDDLQALEWPDAIKAAQREWIGKSEGAEFDFEIAGTDEQVTVFTTRGDTLFGVTYVVLAPEHPLVAKLTASCPNRAAVEAYVAETAKKKERDRLAGAAEKTGVCLEGVTAVNPANGEAVPVWVADYVLGSYGTGAVMAVPAHDARDAEFAAKYGLPVRDVVEPVTGTPQPNEEFRRSIVAVVENPKTGEILTLDWGPQYGGTLFIGGGLEEGEDPVDCAIREVREETGYANLRAVRTAGVSHHHYYAHSKKVARNIEVTGVHLELVDDTRAETSLEETERGKFAVAWLPKAEAERRVRDENHALYFRTFIRGEAYGGDGFAKASGEFDGLSSTDARAKIAAKFGRPKTQYRLRDWLAARQRYWGCPIPVVHCASCGPVGVPEDQLPVELPAIDSYLPADDGSSPLARSAEFVKTTCPKCGGEARRETDTLDTFIDSSWYYYRYADPKNAEAFADPAKLSAWLPVDVYAGGAEHTTMHLLFARFFAKALHSIGLAPHAEPFKYRFNRSLIMGPDGQKMSKSKGNVIDPDQEVAKYGADTVRMYLAFMGPYAEVNAYPWDQNGISGVRRFLERVWNLAERVAAEPAAESSPEVRAAIHRALAKVEEDIARFKFNTAISAMMTCLNEVGAAPVAKADLEVLLKALAPFAPFAAEEMWSIVGNTGSVHAQAWPAVDAGAFANENVTVTVQVNGKLRAAMSTPRGTSEADVLAWALAQPTVQKFLNGAEPKRAIFVPDKLLNLVA